MKKLLTLFVVFTVNAQAAEVCSMYCNPERSKPCGGACISLTKQCHKSWTTACIGENPNKGNGPVYATPMKVNEAPKK